MFTRSLPLQLKPNSIVEFTQPLERDITPLLRKQQGFQGEIAFVVPGGTKAVGVSFWDHKEHADTYPAVLKAWAKVVEGAPQVHTYEVSNSTFHNIVTRAPT